MVIERLKQLLQGIEYAVLLKDRVLVMIKPYEPYIDCTLDAYYFTSNKLYHTSRNIVNTIRAYGNNASIDNTLNFRALAYSSGLATIVGINSMAINEKYGSYFCINVVSTDMDLTELGNVVRTYRTPKPCVNCKLCVSNCPNSAITKDGGFVVGNCIRCYMEGQELSRDMFDKIGNRFLGCDDCQGVCPHNFHINRISVGENIKRLVANALYDYKSFEPIIGKNYARGKVILHNGIIQAGNSKDKRHVDRLLELSKDKRYTHNSKIALEKILDD